MSEKLMEEEGVLPNCITKLEIQNALAKAKNADDLKVVKCVSELINQSGENFCSDIYRVRVKFTRTRAENHETNEEEHLILKVLMPELAEIGTNELVMFEEVLPAMSAILANAEGLNNVKLNASCFHTDNKQKEIYLLENLNVLGYKSADRCVGLDEAHARLCLDKMAKFHAAGMLLHKQQPELIAKLGPSHFANGADDPIAKVILIDGTEYVAQLVSTWPGYEQIANKISNQLEQYNKRMQVMVLPTNSKFNVLVHGDLWVNNALFSYEDNKPVDAILVDFQNAFYGSPAIDLHFFFYTSLQLSVLETKREELLLHYYDCFADTLRACGSLSLLPAYQVLLDELKRCDFYSYYATVCEMPLCCMDKITSEGFNAGTFGDSKAMLEKRLLLYKNKRVQDTLRYCLRCFDKQGLFDTI